MSCRDSAALRKSASHNSSNAFSRSSKSSESSAAISVPLRIYRASSQDNKRKKEEMIEKIKPAELLAVALLLEGLLSVGILSELATL
jgi:hypothetical protein